jgi:GntR family transcriptional regulator
MQVEPGLIPRYYQLKDILEKRIQSGEFQPGDQFPTDDSLCDQYSLSRGTVKRAVDLLVEKGLLRREQGRGTYVTSPILAPVAFHLADFNEDMRRRGRQPGTKVLQQRVIPAGKEIAEALGLQPDEQVIEIVRLRLADNQPMAYEIRHLAYKICPDLLQEGLENQSIHSLLIDKYNIPLIRARLTIEARVLNEHEARLLQAKRGSAGFYLSRITYTHEDRPVTWYRIIYRGDEYRFTAEF